MKKIVCLFLLLPVFLTAKAQTNVAEQAAFRWAKRLTDSLNLSEQQRNSIYGVNLALNNEKLFAIDKNKNPITLRLQLQAIESKRDSLYRPVLTAIQFQAYQVRKSVIFRY